MTMAQVFAQLNIAALHKNKSATPMQLYENKMNSVYL